MGGNSSNQGQFATPSIQPSASVHSVQQTESQTPGQNVHWGAGNSSNQGQSASIQSAPADLREDVIQSASPGKVACREIMKSLKPLHGNVGALLQEVMQSQEEQHELNLDGEVTERLKMKKE